MPIFTFVFALVVLLLVASLAYFTHSQFLLWIVGAQTLNVIWQAFRVAKVLP